MERGADDTRELRGAVESFTLRVLSAAAAKKAMPILIHNSHIDSLFVGVGILSQGLWPERKDGSWPSNCSEESFDPSVIDELGRERFLQHWPNVKFPPSSPEYDDFWVHEWTKHGTCSGLSQKDYFESALESYVPTPALVKMAEGAKVPKKELIAAYGGGSNMVALVCDARRYLSEVRVCVGKDAVGKATGRIPCNEGVLREASCSEDEVYISTFPHTGVE